MTPEEAESIKRYKRFCIRRPDGNKQPLERYNFDKIYTNETIRHELKLQRQQIAIDILKHESRNFTQLGEIQLWNDIKLKRRKKSNASRPHRVRSTIPKCAVHAPQQCHASGVGLRPQPSIPVKCR